MRFFAVPLLLFSLTTCASLPSQGRMPAEALESAWESSEWEPLFVGVDIRVVHVTDFPARIYILRIDPFNDTEILLTDPGTLENGWIQPVTTSAFAQSTRVQIAVNASFYQKSGSGDLVKSLGLWVVNGKELSPPHPTFSSFGISQNGEPAIYDAGDAIPELLWGIGGGVRILKEGNLVTRDDDIHPRTALGFSVASGRQKLFLAVADGRQTHSRGIGLRDLGQLLLFAGAQEALNLDGGGSSTLVVQGKDGIPALLNSPWDNRFNGGERAVVNHIGIRAQPLP